MRKASCFFYIQIYLSIFARVFQWISRKIPKIDRKLWLLYENDAVVHDIINIMSWTILHYEERNVREAVWNADGAPGSEAGEQSETLLALQVPVRKRNGCGGITPEKWTYKELRLLPQNSTEKAGPGFDRLTFRSAPGSGSSFRCGWIPDRLEMPVRLWEAVCLQVSQSYIGSYKKLRMSSGGTAEGKYE